MEVRNYNIKMRDRAVVARESHKLEVAGSIPAPATKFLGRLLGNIVWSRVKACGDPRLTAQDGSWLESPFGLVGFPVK